MAWSLLKLHSFSIYALTLAIELSSFEFGWSFYFRELLFFRLNHGNSSPKRSCAVVDLTSSIQIKLGIWVMAQRAAFRSGKLTTRKQALLQSVGLSWSPRDTTWEQKFSRLSKYVWVNGHCNIPIRHSSNLGIWMNSQRTRFFRGTLRPNRFRKLQTLGFLPRAWDENWESRFCSLLAFKQAQGHCFVAFPHRRSCRSPEGVRLPIHRSSQPCPIRTSSSASASDLSLESVSLGFWVNRQRRLHRCGRLQANRTARLAAMGFFGNQTDNPRRRAGRPKGRKKCTESRSSAMRKPSPLAEKPTSPPAGADRPGCQTPGGAGLAVVWTSPAARRRRRFASSSASHERPGRRRLWRPAAATQADLRNHSG